MYKSGGVAVAKNSKSRKDFGRIVVGIQIDLENSQQRKVETQVNFGGVAAREQDNSSEIRAAKNRDIGKIWWSHSQRIG